MMQDRDQIPTVAATGDVVLTRNPDVAYISLYIRADGILLEDAVTEANAKVDQVHRGLRDKYSENIREIHIQDVHLGDGKPAVGMIRDKSNPARPEVVKGILIIISPKPELAVAIVDTACRAGCLMSNPAGTHMPAVSSVILYGLADPSDAEEEATALAIVEARDKASRIAKGLQKKIGDIRSVNLMVFHSPEEFTRRNKTPLLARGTYLSIRPDRVEIPGRVSAMFQLID